MSEIEFPIYWSDLTPEAQSRLLEAYKAKTAEEMNWDVYPVDTLYVYPHDYWKDK